ncbi:MAG: SurA N-terminal domain-containing protein [Dehalococcoidia bacterium]
MSDNKTFDKKSDVKDKRYAKLRDSGLKKRQRLVITAMVISILVVISTFIIGYIIVFVMPPRELVVRVNDVEYTRGDLLELVRIDQKTTEFMGGKFDASSVVFESLQQTVENEIINQIAPSHGITISEEQVDSMIDDIMRPSESASLGKSEEQISRETSERYLAYLNTLQISQEKHRSIVRNEAIRERFRQYIGDSVPYVTEQVYLHRIITPITSEMEIMIIKFDDLTRDAVDPIELREAYKSVVREFSRDNSEIIRLGGEIGWVPRNVLLDYENLFFDLVPGELSEPIPDPNNDAQLIFFMISDREEARELDIETRDELKTKALQDWINIERKSHNIYAVFNSDIYNWIFQQLRLTTIEKQPTPDPSGGLLEDAGF